eukprot:SAG11_NODE_34024_length_274_cov_0.594286_1_plen_50_part_10
MRRTDLDSSAGTGANNVYYQVSETTNVAMPAWNKLVVEWDVVVWHIPTDP